ncbi:major capsid protein [Paludibacterium denitrificans]|uniref:Major capsid protein n=1 Tax=Paludibacterium denitrificans TaxID=2675226 RepID=A0A844G887_9NEIS|nr:major capsid protein [Paludibacterium denitrificans]MTD32523.1 major capsid protein [Paludibacterium denitrificans]
MPQSLADILKDPCFNVASLTESIKLLPNTFSKVGQSGIFKGKGINTRTVAIEYAQGRIHLLANKDVGSPGQRTKRNPRNVRYFGVPHIPHDDTILAADLIGSRTFGSSDTLTVADVASVVNDHLQDMKSRHDLTREWMMLGAAKGQILDGDGQLMYDLFKEFGIQKKVIEFKLSDPAFNVKKACADICRHVEKNLLGDVSNGIKAWVDADFFDAFTTHPNVEKAFFGWAAAQEALGGDTRSGFKFGGVTFEEYTGEVPTADGKTSVSLIASGRGHVVPLGTMSTFAIYDAPGDFIEAVGTIGQPYYAKIKNTDFDRGVDLHTQSNPLPLCLRPGVLVELQLK